MNKFYSFFAFTALCLFALTSCSRKFNFTTKGLPETDSSYLVTTDGKRIEASTIEVRTNNKVKVDGQERSLDDIMAIKSKKMYFGVNDGQLYLGDTYGKICLLYKIQYSTTYQNNMALAGGGFSGNGMPGSYNTTSSRIEYLQKKGSPDIDKLNSATLIDYVSDNDEALALAKGGKTWNRLSYIPLAGVVTGSVLTVVKVTQNGSNTTSSELRAPLLILGISLPAYYIAAGISSHKMHKAIRIYNK